MSSACSKVVPDICCVRRYPYIEMIFAAAELDDFVHDLRHSFASEALSSGYTLDQIGQLLGHTDIQTTQRYAHLGRTAKHAAADELARRMAVLRLKFGDLRCAPSSGRLKRAAATFTQPRTNPYAVTTLRIAPVRISRSSSDAVNEGAR